MSISGTSTSADLASQALASMSTEQFVTMIGSLRAKRKRRIRRRVWVAIALLTITALFIWVV